MLEIDGDTELEALHRELLPVVQVDGETAFTWFVDPEALRERLSRPLPDAAGTM